MERNYYAQEHNVQVHNQRLKPLRGCLRPESGRPATQNYATAIGVGDFNDDGVADIVVTTTGRFAPYPVVANVILSRCEWQR
jgi:hypothetical protein